MRCRCPVVSRRAAALACGHAAWPAGRSLPIHPMVMRQPAKFPERSAACIPGGVLWLRLAGPRLPMRAPGMPGLRTQLEDHLHPPVPATPRDLQAVMSPDIGMTPNLR